MNFHFSPESSRDDLPDSGTVVYDRSDGPDSTGLPCHEGEVTALEFRRLLLNHVPILTTCQEKLSCWSNSFDKIQMIILSK